MRLWNTIDQNLWNDKKNYRLKENGERAAAEKKYHQKPHTFHAVLAIIRITHSWEKCSRRICQAVCTVCSSSVDADLHIAMGQLRRSDFKKSPSRKCLHFAEMHILIAANRSETILSSWLFCRKNTRYLKNAPVATTHCKRAQKSSVLRCAMKLAWSVVHINGMSYTL